VFPPFIADGNIPTADEIVINITLSGRLSLIQY